MAESADAGWTIRPSNASDTDPLIELFRAAFGRSITSAHWQWKLQHLSAPVANDWIALDGNRPIFHSGGIPIRYQLPTGEVTGMVSVDTMTAPEYRRRGLLTQVGQQMYSAWREGGIPFVIGLINDQWGSRAPALGWQPLFPLRWLIRPLRPAAILARRLRVSGAAQLRLIDSLWNSVLDTRTPMDSSLQVRLLDRAGSEVNEVWKRCQQEAGVSIVRDSAWVNWRYRDCPSFPYQVLLVERAGMPVAYAAFRVERTPRSTLGYIAELLGPRHEPAVMGTLIRQTLAQLRAAGAELAAAQVPSGTWYYAALRRAGFVWTWGDFSVQLVPLDASVPMDFLRNQANWTMWGGDYDSI